MPFEHKNLLIRFGGTFGASSTANVDQWSSGFRAGSPVADVTHDPVKALVLATAIETALAALHSQSPVGAGTNCWLSYVTVARVGLDGKYDPDTQETVRKDRSPLAGASSPLFPWNTAQVISLRTTRPRGAASNGRMYYPMLSASLDTSTGRLSASSNGNRLGAFKTFFDSVNVALGVYEAGTRVVVASNVGAGRNAIVTSIRADTRLDSIERRENNQPPAWTTTGLA